MSKDILYITFVDFNEQKSGSSVRPKKIYDAFLEEGYKITLLTGLQNRKLERWKNCLEFYKSIKKGNFDFCYVEPPAGPIFNLCDHLLLLYISKIKKIPIGIFYRDAYWKFADWYQLKGIKRFIINTMHKFDWRIIKKTCEKVYFPTKTMGDLFDFKEKEALPPGCELLSVDDNINKNVEIVYVGGVSEEYGGKLLLETLDKVNKDKKMILHLVCRKEEVSKLGEYKNRPWLNIYHVSGNELKEVYSKANLAIIPRKIDFYMDFSMPVKLFEYISYELPIIATRCKEVAKFIEDNNIGLVTDDNVESLYEALMKVNVDDILEYNKNVKIAKKNNTWNERVKQISRLSNI